MTPARDPIWLRARGGSRDGQVLPFDQDRVTIGRSPEADVRFDPEQDRAVSAHQATLAWSDGQWFVRDLGSRNGTHVAGVRVDGDVILEHGSVISFGPDGPSLEFLTQPPGVDPPPTSVSDADSRTMKPTPVAAEGMTQRIRAEVGRETRRLRVLVLGLSITLAVVFLSTRNRSTVPPEWEAQRAALLQFVDSVLRTSDDSGQALAGELDELAAALEASQEQVRSLRSDLESAQRDEDGTDALQSQLQAATLALQRQQLAAAVDYEAIGATSRPSVAAIWADMGDGEVFTGTAFMIADGLLATSAHVLSGELGDRTPERVAVRFSGRRDVIPAEPVAASVLHDVALLRVGLDDPPPPLTLNGTPDTIPEGRPVVVIGYPLGGAEPRDPSATVPRALLSVGLLLSASSSEVRIQGYGAEGASGSPVFDEHGQVVAVVRGGVRDATTQTLVAVSASALRDLIASLP